MFKDSIKIAALSILGFLPLGLWLVPSPLPEHSLDWYISHTPKCWGPLCYNVYSDRTDLSLELKWVP